MSETFKAVFELLDLVSNLRLGAFKVYFFVCDLFLDGILCFDLSVLVVLVKNLIQILVSSMSHFRSVLVDAL